MKLNVKTSDLPDLFFGVYRLKLNDLSDSFLSFFYIFFIFLFFSSFQIFGSVLLLFAIFMICLFCELIIELSFHEYYILYSFQFFQLKKIKHSLARLNSVLSICSNSIFLFCYCTTNIFQCMFNISHEINTKTSTISALIS